MPLKTRVRVERRLRPTRFARLCRISDLRAVIEAIQINTVLWGGGFNPIIPLYLRRPPWLTHSRLRGLDVSRGLIEGFQPDFLIASNEDEVERVGWDKRRALTLNEFRRSDEGKAFSAGTDVAALYEHLFETRFRFEQRVSDGAVIPLCSSPAIQPAVWATFGSFPSSAAGKPLFGELFEEVFSPQITEVTPANLYPLLAGLYPLRAASTGLEVVPGRTRSWPSITFHLFDPRSPIDVMEFWNLRTADADVLPVPLPWLDEMGPSFEWLMERIAPGTGSPARPPDIRLIQGRSVGAEVFESFQDYLRRSFDDSEIRFGVTHYPRIWDPWGRETDGFRLAEVTANRADHEIATLDDRRVNFEDLEPEFSEYTPSYSVSRWTNVIRIRDYSGDPHFPGTYPPDLGDLRTVVGDFNLEGVWTSTEGLVAPSNYRRAPRSWRVPTGVDLFEQLFKKHGYEFSLSDAGRVTEQIATRLGSRNAVSMLKNLDLIRFFNRMADGFEPTGAHLLEMLKRQRELFPQAPKNRLKHLLSSGLMKVGLEIQCDTCRARNLVELDALNESIKCRRCLDEFEFPAADPPSIWRYRIAGPMGSPNYARGGYTTLLAVNFLERVAARSGSLAWTPSFHLRRGDALLEADFAILLKQSEFDSGWPRLFVGESKSENSFERRDAKRLRELARAFPGAILVAATLKEELTRTEKRLLVPIARAPWRRRSSSHLVVLTQRELLWDEIGGWEDAEGRRLYLHGPDAWRELAVATQRLNLGYDAYSEIKR